MTPDSEANPIISVVTVCLNARDTLRTAIESVLAQTYATIEYIIVDGGSTDGTLDIIREFEPRFAGQMRWLSEPDRGLYDAMNKGIAVATGNLIGTLNADDFYEPDAVSNAVKTWLAHPQAGVVYGDLRTFGRDGVASIVTTPGTVSLEQLRRRMLLNHPATFVSPDTYRRLGCYDISHPIAADYDFFLRCLEAGIEFAKADAVLTNFSLLGTTHRNVRLTDRDATLVRIKHGVSPLVAWARFYKRAFANAVYGALRHVPLFRAAYQRYKGQL